MDNIRQALERARALEGAGAEQKVPLRQPSQAEPPVGIGHPAPASIAETVLDIGLLESNRIIAHDETDPRTRAFDMLRTQVLQAMDQRNRKFLGITSPTPGCGKTVTAINLAMSIARQPERSVLLVDLDLQKPRHIATSLGIECASGVFSVLEGHTNLASTVIAARAGHSHIAVLPTEKSTTASSAWMVSREMSTMLQEIRRDYRSHIVIVDLPPVLSSDDVIALLPQLDCALLVASVGRTTVAEIEECNRHLQSADVLRLVLNKVTETNSQYYPNYSAPPRQG